MHALRRTHRRVRSLARLVSQINKSSPVIYFYFSIHGSLDINSYVSWNNEYPAELRKIFTLMSKGGSVNTLGNDVFDQQSHRQKVI